MSVGARVRTCLAGRIATCVRACGWTDAARWIDGDTMRYDGDTMRYDAIRHDGWMMDDGWMDGWMDESIDGWMDR